MRTNIDTRILGPLADRVARLCKSMNDPHAVAMGKDSSWDELTHDALPNLEAYLSEADVSSPTPIRDVSGSTAH